MSTAESPRKVSEGAQPGDPLLKSGRFLDSAESCDPETPAPGTPKHRGDSSSNGAGVAADPVSGKAIDSSGTEVAEAAGSATLEDSKGRRRIRSPADAPDWLPKGWIVEDRVRTSGATAGSIDKYYTDPVTRQVFRSKNEVLHYVETGTRLKRKKNVDGPDGERMDVVSSGGRRQKKAAPLPPPSFDFDNVPTVTWVLEDSSNDSWVPHMDDHEVPKPVQQQWSSAFSWITSKFR
ncbi:hypothetical protein MLD38_003973 [Melastoma candidum]|uniref:Uncharacterized protein n=1 Tax=Melastoma candidum TaxID=119954 RepID=A0ACB9S5K9_9MYRT|nr:hypothetical protein MLD38_003973 [Melastoma candidum]